MVSVGRVQLGVCDLSLSRMGFGTGTSKFELESHQSRQDPEQLAGLLLAAHSHGITWWDTSDNYATHPHVALALSGVDRASVQISTKTHARTEAEARRAVEQALRELGTGSIDLFFMHDVDDPAEIPDRRGAFEGLLAAKAEGLIAAIGLSTHNIDTLEACVDLTGLDVVMTNYNRFEDHMDAGLKHYTLALEAHHRAGRGVAVMKAVGEGRLAHVAAESIRWNLERPFVHAVLVGMERLEEVVSNARTALEADLTPGRETSSISTGSR